MAHTLTLIITITSTIYLAGLALYFRSRCKWLDIHCKYWYDEFHREHRERRTIQSSCLELEKKIERLQDMKNYADSELDFELWEEAHRQQRELMKLLEQKK